MGSNMDPLDPVYSAYFEAKALKEILEMKESLYLLGSLILFWAVLLGIFFTIIVDEIQIVKKLRARLAESW